MAEPTKFICRRAPNLKVTIIPTRHILVDGVPIVQAGLTVQFINGELKLINYPEDQWNNICKRIRHSDWFGSAITEVSAQDELLLRKRAEIEKKHQREIEEELAQEEIAVKSKEDAKEAKETAKETIKETKETIREIRSKR